MESEILAAKTGNSKGFARKVMKKFAGNFREKKVFVKPNIVSSEGYPTTTHPDVLKEVIESLLSMRCEVVVGDGPAVDAGNSDEIIRNHPLYEVCASCGVELVNLHKKGFRKVKTQSGFSIRVSEVPMECEKIISLPVIKSHKWTVITGCLKNQFGFFQNRERIMVHAGLKNMHRAIAEVNTMLGPDLCIADMVESYRKNNEKRHGGIGIKPGYMLAGRDAVALDCKGFEILKGFDRDLKAESCSDIKHIKYACELGVGKTEWKESVIRI